MSAGCAAAAAANSDRHGGERGRWVRRVDIASSGWGWGLDFGEDTIAATLAARLQFVDPPPPLLPPPRSPLPPRPHNASVPGRGLGSRGPAGRAAGRRAPARRGGAAGRAHADGVPLEELKQAVKEQRLALVPVERLLGGEQRYRAGEIAEREPGSTSTPCWRPGGRSACRCRGPSEGARGEDLEAAKIGRRFRDAGFDDEDLLEANRVLGRGMARYVGGAADDGRPARCSSRRRRARARAALRGGRRRLAAALRAVAGLRVPAAPAPGAAQRGGHAARSCRPASDGPDRSDRLRRPRRLHRARARPSASPSSASVAGEPPAAGRGGRRPARAAS